jgi:hypothetical protein
MSISGAVAVKVKMDAETRRFSLADLTFDQLLKTVQERFDQTSAEIQLSYLDPEGDEVVFSSDEELGEAIRISRMVGGVLRLDARKICMPFSRDFYLSDFW